MREFCTSGSVGGRSKRPAYPADSGHLLSQVSVGPNVNAPVGGAYVEELPIIFERERITHALRKSVVGPGVEVLCFCDVPLPRYRGQQESSLFNVSEFGTVGMGQLGGAAAS